MNPLNREQPRFGILTPGPYSLIGPTLPKGDFVVISNETKPSEQSKKIPDLKIKPKPKEIGNKQKTYSCFNSALLLGVLAVAIIALNVIGILGTSSFTIAATNLGLLAFSSIVVIYRELIENSSNTSRYLKTAFLIASLVLNSLVVASAFNISSMPGEIGAAQLLLFAVGITSVAIAHFSNRSRR